MIYSGVGNTQNKDGPTGHKPNYRHEACHCPRPPLLEPPFVFMCRLRHLVGFCTEDKRLKIAKPLRVVAPPARIEGKESCADAHQSAESILMIMRS